jgi:hypothetical protein
MQLFDFVIPPLPPSEPGEESPTLGPLPCDYSRGWQTIADGSNSVFIRTVMPVCLHMVYGCFPSVLHGKVARSNGACKA